MRDDDDPEQDEYDGDSPEEAGCEGGNVFFFDARSEAWHHGIEPADYALPRGVPALQGHGPEWPVQAPAQGSVSRRAVLTLFGLGAASAVSGFAVSGFWAATLVGARATKSEREALGGSSAGLTDREIVMIEGARKLATGPAQDLARYARPFIVAVESLPEDPILNAGLTRLAEIALADFGERGFEIARHLLVAWEARPACMPDLALASRLRERVRRQRDQRRRNR